MSSLLQNCFNLFVSVTRDGRNMRCVVAKCLASIINDCVFSLFDTVWTSLLVCLTSD